MLSAQQAAIARLLQQSFALALLPYPEASEPGHYGIHGIEAKSTSSEYSLPYLLESRPMFFQKNDARKWGAGGLLRFEYMHGLTATGPAGPAP